MMDFYEKPSLEDLEHYGVLGMKWGVRRTPEQLGHHRIKKGTLRQILQRSPMIFPEKLVEDIINGEELLIRLKTKRILGKKGVSVLGYF